MRFKTSGYFFHALSINFFFFSLEIHLENYIEALGNGKKSEFVYVIKVNRKKW